jgi:hypothetical protein
LPSIQIVVPAGPVTRIRPLSVARTSLKTWTVVGLKRSGSSSSVASLVRAEANAFFAAASLFKLM